MGWAGGKKEGGNDDFIFLKNVLKVKIRYILFLFMCTWAYKDMHVCISDPLELEYRQL